MKVKLISYVWNVFAGVRSEYDTLPQTGYVYMIVVKSVLFKKRKIVYIGVTDNLRQRMKSHSLLLLLRRNMGSYSIEILYRDFNKNTNHEYESMLIRKYRPPCNNNILPKYRIWGLWKELGIENVCYGESKQKARSLK